MEIVNQKQNLPNSTAVLVLGIISLVPIPFCAPINLILAIIGLVISREGKNLYFQNPDKYNGYGNLNAGRILCIISIALWGIGLLTVLTLVAIGSTILGSILGIFG